MALHRFAEKLQPVATDRPMRVFLVGMMGSGKSSVGRALSDRTGWPFVDNDALVERVTGMTARQLLEERGADGMRAAETAALVAGTEVEPPAIVATAAGTILDPDNRRRVVEAGFVAWLRAPASVLAARAVGAAHRPWLEDDPVGWFESAQAERDPLYASVADLEVDTSVITPADAAEVILQAATIGR
jgi:shikimate kinase